MKQSVSAIKARFRSIADNSAKGAARTSRSRRNKCICPIVAYVFLNARVLGRGRGAGRARKGQEGPGRARKGRPYRFTSRSSSHNDDVTLL
jgi:hypothetical protein